MGAQRRLHDGHPLVAVGHVDPPHLVEAALAEQLGRQLLGVVGRRHHEGLTGTVLHPRQDGPERISGHAAVAGVPGRTGQSLLHFVEPDDAPAHGLDHAERLAKVLLALTHVLALERPEIHPQQRHTPRRGDRLRGQGLAATGHPDQQRALGRGQTVLAGSRAVRRRTRHQPRFQVVQTAHGIQTVGQRVDPLQHPLAGDHPLLLGGDGSRVDGPRLHQRAREAGLHLLPGQAHRRVDGGVTVTVDRRLANVCGQGLHGGVQQGRDLLAVGQRPLDDGGVPRQLRRHLPRGGDDDDGLRLVARTARQRAGQVAKPPQASGTHGRGQPDRQVAHHPHGALVGGVADRVECGIGITDGVLAGADRIAPEVGDARGDVPEAGVVPGGGGGFEQVALDAGLLPGDDPQQWVACPQQRRHVGGDHL